MVCTACNRGIYYKKFKEENGKWMDRYKGDEWPSELKYSAENQNGCRNCGGFGWVACELTCPSGQKYWMSNSINGMTIYDGKRLKSMCGKDLIYSRGLMTKAFFDEMGFEDPFEEK